jgi:hypothetical protein
MARERQGTNGSVYVQIAGQLCREITKAAMALAQREIAQDFVSVLSKYW